MIADDPVRLTVTTPAAIVVHVDADAGALDPRAGALHVRVKLAARCGGSFAGTSGIIAIDATPAQPTPGTPYTATIQAAPSAPAGRYSVCVFLDDDEGRQWATDVDETIVVDGAGTTTPGTTTPTGCQKLAKLPTSFVRGSLIERARVTRKRGRAVLLIRVRTPARVSVKVRRRALKTRRPRPCRTVAIRLPGRHGKARLAVSIKRGTERRTIAY